jgi:hypothetical protein
MAVAQIHRLAKDGVDGHHRLAVQKWRRAKVLQPDLRVLDGVEGIGSWGSWLARVRRDIIAATGGGNGPESRDSARSRKRPWCQSRAAGKGARR